MAFTTISWGKVFTLYLFSIAWSSARTMPKNSFYSKAIDRALNIRGTPLGFSVNNSTLGTEGESLMKVSALELPTSITLLWMKRVAQELSFFYSIGPS